MNYILIPEDVDSNLSIPDKAKRLYGYILRLHLMRNGCFAQNKYFAERIHTNNRQIQRYIHLLREHHCISVYFKRDSKHRITSRQLVPKIKIDTK